MWNLVKLPKLIALLAFILPWMTVSCSGTRLVSATGYGLAFGHLTTSMQQVSASSSDARANLWLVLAMIVIATGTVLACRGRSMARAVLATSALGLGLIWIGTARYSKTALLDEASKRSGTPLDQTAMAMIQVDWQIGFWIAVLALVTAAVMAWLAMSGRDAEIERRVRGANDQNDRR